jgi:serine/threonine protein kinase
VQQNVPRVKVPPSGPLSSLPAGFLDVPPMLPRIEPHEQTRAPNVEPIPGYRLIAPLGAGGFGEVWKCEVPGGLFKAIKFVHGGDGSLLGNDISSAEQELRALQHVKSIRHPFLLSMDRVEIVGGELVIVMELADKSLHDLLVESQATGAHGLPRVDLLLYLREAAEVLDLMNLECGLQHLDIKPRNLFLVSGHVKVADFGLVNTVANFPGATDDPCGGSPADPGGGATPVQLGAFTPLYASPECFEGRISLFSDQYSLAIVYCELLSGKLPFSGKNQRQLMLQHTMGEPDLSALPEGDRPLVARALAKDPRQRFPSSLAFVRALIARESPSPASADTASTANSKAATIHDLCLVEKARVTPLPSLLGGTPTPDSNGSRSTPTRVVPVRGSGAPSGAPGATDQPGEPSPDKTDAGGPTPGQEGFHFLECLGRSPLGEMWKTETPEGSVQLVKLVNTFSQTGLFGEDDPVERLQSIRHRGLLSSSITPYPPNRLAVVTPMTTDNLGTRLQQCREQGQTGIPREELLERLHAAAETLDALQKMYDIQHLGLNPRNLMLVNDQLQIADFGLMALVWMPAAQEAGQINPRYSAPELFGRIGDTSPLRNCDQYSLALIYHELLTGTHLFGNLSQRQLALARASGRLGLDLVPAPDRPALLRALDPDPNQRYRSCIDFLRALGATESEQRQPGAEDEGRVLLGSAREPDDEPASEDQPLLADVLNQKTEEVIAELVASAAGSRELREFRNVRCIFHPGESIEHTCYARLVPGTLPLKLGSFREQWNAEPIEENEDRFLFRVRLQSSFWQRCLGRQPGLDILVEALPSRSPHAVMTELCLRVVPSGCGHEDGAAALEDTGPLLIDSLRTHLQAGPERRRKVRLPFEQTVHACPVRSDKRLGEPFLCQGKDISLRGMGLYLPCKPPPNYLVLQLRRSPGEPPVPVAAQVIRSQPCGDGRFEVGLKFLKN